MFGFFKEKVEKREFDELKAGVQTAFNSIKQDNSSFSSWIKHLDSNDKELKDELLEVQEELSTIKEEFENFKNMISIVGRKDLFKQGPTVFNKQTAFNGVLNSVQTGVQTAFLDNLSATERAIIFVLLNSDMKLSYEDLAAMLGKRKATIRGQVNSIRQKNEGLIEEIIGENNKKRVFIPGKIKEILLKAKEVRNIKKKGKGED